jgi:glycosyltransferase involved in cell wall biosynthesis
MHRLLIFYPSHSAVCGIGTWIECLAEQLQRRHWDVWVGLSWGQRFHNPAVIEEMHPNLRTIRLDARTGTQTGRVLAIQNAIRKVKPDVALVTLLDDALRTMQLEKRRGSNVRFAFANHGNSPEHLAAAIELSGELDLAVSVNRASYDVLRLWPNAQWGADSLHYIPNAVPAASAEQRPGCGKIRLGFVGRLAWDKGAEQLELLVVALRNKNCDFHLTIAGDGPLREEIGQLSERFPDQILFLGPQSREQLYQKVYPTLDVILCLSPSEGWPMAIAEAMIHGVVPVSSDYTGIQPEGVIRHDETGLLFPVGRPEVAADRIVELEQDSERLHRLQAAAQQMISQNFSLEQFGSEWDSCLRAAIQRPPRKSSTNDGQFQITVFDRTKEWIRRSLGRSVAHQSIRAEWPMIAPKDSHLTDEVQHRLSNPGSKFHRQPVAESSCG